VVDDSSGWSVINCPWSWVINWVCQGAGAGRGTVSGEVRSQVRSSWRKPRSTMTSSNWPSYRSQAAAAEGCFSQSCIRLTMMIESISLTLSQVNPRYESMNPHSSRESKSLRCAQWGVTACRPPPSVKWIAYADAAGRASTDINLGGHAIVDRRLVLLLWRSCSSQVIIRVDSKTSTLEPAATSWNEKNASRHHALCPVKWNADVLVIVAIFGYVPLPFANV
jgi:hypothetical protein